MDASAGKPPEWSGRPREPLQPASRDIYESLPDDERLDRILGDADLLYRLQLSGYAPEEWRRPAEEFGRYGYDVMVGWMFKGRIWDEVYKKTQRHLSRPAEPFDADTIHDLCSDTVVKALQSFLDNVLKKNRWDPRRGASLKTYFVGQCCFQFGNVLRAHYRRVKRSREDPVEDPAEWTNLCGSNESADAQVMRNEQNAAAFAVVSSDKAREAFALQWLGYSEAEIADRMGEADEKAIENLLGYQRRKLRKQRGETG